MFTALLQDTDGTR